jgi:DAK2 domain fusion protein YloV
MADKKITIDAKLLKHMFINGAQEMAKHYAYIDELNVFPVPDGDTGTNMKITLEGASNAIKDVEYTDLFQLGKQFSRGLLMNARGNSGVITSQIFKGMTGLFTEGQAECDVAQFVDCFDNARKIAYAAVSNPIEGTILTVIRVTAEKLMEKKAEFTSVDEVLDYAIKVAEETLSKSPDMLPELKEVGVVDSGGYGLCKILTGMNNALDIELGKQVSVKTEIVQPKKTLVSNFKDDNEGFGYCNEFIMTIGSKVDLKQKDKMKFDLTRFKEDMNKLGDCLVVVVDDNLVKVHIHTTKPYEILKYGSQYGEFNKVKIENMTLQFLERNPGTTLEELANKKKGINE